jgi:hypothetical protein
VRSTVAASARELIRVATSLTYPVHIDAELDQPLSRWLWLVKWVLAIPHFVVLAFLWAAFVLLSFVSFLAIVFTGRYPRAIFEFNVGVLRWTWRVSYYAFGALGTDRYPPFTLAQVPDYPAHLDVDYPANLSRGLVLVKWWLLAIPHYVIVAILVGGAWTAARQSSAWGGDVGLISVLVLIAAVILLFTGSYPRPLFDLVLGMNRWVLRVAGYASLMTDEYPPFRLDMGGSEPSSLVVPPRDGPSEAAATAASARPEPATALTTAPVVGPTPSRWSVGPVIGVVLGSMAALTSLGMLAGGSAVLWADHIARGSDGYLTTPAWDLSTSRYALASDRIDLAAGGPDVQALLPDRWLGTVRLRVTPVADSGPVFVGLAPTVAARSYLAGTAYTTVSAPGPVTTYIQHDGTAPTQPSTQAIWVASASGSGVQTLTWKPQRGDWTIVVMNADASNGVSVRADIGATAPSLGWVEAALLLGGFLVAGVAVVLLVVSVSSANRRPTPATSYA